MGIPGCGWFPNFARCGDAVRGRPAAGLVDQLTSGVITTDALRRDLTVIDEARAARLRLVVGDEGSGKSTLLALFIRPKIVDTLQVPDHYIKAAAFLDGSSTLESLANELATQLEKLPGFRDAAAAVAADLSEHQHNELGAWDTKVRLPLARVSARTDRPGHC